MLASGGAELVSSGAIVPFLAVLSDPERLAAAASPGPCVSPGVTESSELLVPVTLVFAGGAVLAALIRLANLWLLDVCCSRRL